MAVKPDTLVAPVFGVDQWPVPFSLSLPPATLSPPKYVVRVVQSTSVAICQLAGASLPEFWERNHTTYDKPNWKEMTAIANVIYNAIMDKTNLQK
jgi:hypothetical protein